MSLKLWRHVSKLDRPQHLLLLGGSGLCNARFVSRWRLTASHPTAFQCQSGFSCRKVGWVG
jgi:hypothetical protein